ncbi:beta-ketoacyl synthase N-terminal-like domain-containing protein [Paenibacillus rhizoplanae]
METGYEAIEDAGYGGERIRNADTGVYVGFSEARYKDMVSEDVPAAFVGNFPPVVASRLSYALNLSGPAVSIATACSSSLVALHLACEGLHAGDCSMALVGG